MVDAEGARPKQRALVLLLALFIVACGPSRADIPGEYRLKGDPGKPDLIWRLSPDGGFVAMDGQSGSTWGTWRYEPDGLLRDGRLTVATEFVSHTYAVSRMTGVGLAIIVDADKAVAFHQHEAYGAAEQ